MNEMRIRIIKSDLYELNYLKNIKRSRCIDVNAGDSISINIQ